MAEANEVATMVQLLIDNPKLDRYFHADTQPDRKPLIIDLEGAPGANLDDVRKFGMPVKVRAPDQSGGPVLSVKVERPADGQTRIGFSYEVEGIVGHAIFSQSGGKPVLAEMSVIEQD